MSNPILAGPPPRPPEPEPDLPTLLLIAALSRLLATTGAPKYVRDAATAWLEHLEAPGQRPDPPVTPPVPPDTLPDSPQEQP